MRVRLMVEFEAEVPDDVDVDDLCMRVPDGAAVSMTDVGGFDSEILTYNTVHTVQVSPRPPGEANIDEIPAITERSRGKTEVRWITQDWAAVALEEKGSAGILCDFRTSALIDRKAMLANAAFVSWCFNGYNDPATAEEVEAARERYAKGSNDDIEIDDDALASRADDGTWVQAWVWLPREEVLG